MGYLSESTDWRAEHSAAQEESRRLRARVAELEQELACVTKDRDSWREQSRAHNIDRIKGHDRIAQMEAQLAGADAAFKDCHANCCEDDECPYCKDYREDWKPALTPEAPNA